MGSVALGARVLLAFVFAVAAAAKLADQSGTRIALRDFGLPHRVHVPLAAVLPLAELLTAAALLVQPSARWGALATLVLLTTFATGIAAAMARGEAPDCHCFGQLRSAPAGRGTLIRNALLAAPAVFVLADGPGTSLDSWFPSRSAADDVAIIALTAGIVLAAIALQLHVKSTRLRRDLKRVRDATEAFPAGPPIGAPAPRFTLPDVDGKVVALDELLTTRRPVAMVFISPDCEPCEIMFPALSSWQRRLAHRMTIVIVGRGTARELQALSEAHGLRNVLVDQESELFEAYRTPATPSAVIVTAEGMVGTAMHSTVVIVEALIRRALADLDGSSPASPNGGAVATDDGGLEVVRWAAPSRA